LPISIVHIISLRRLIIQGIPAGIFSISGYLFGQFLFLICVIFGIRFILIPWLTFEPLNYILGFILIFRIIYRMTQESLTPISGWSWKNSKYQNFFLTSFVLAWCEQTSIFQYLGNISITSNPTILEGFSTNSAITSLLNHSNYLIGILIGSILFTLGWGLIFLKVRDFILSYTPLFTSSFIQILNKGTFVLTLAFSLSTIPYYGLDYLVTGPLGFVSQDRTFTNSLFSQYNVKDSVNFFGDPPDFPSLKIDVAPFDRGRYLIYPKAPEVFSFEDLNYRGEADWTRRSEKQTMTDSRTGFLTLSKFLKTKQSQIPSSSLIVEKNSSDFEKMDKLNSLIPEQEVSQSDSSTRNPRDLRFQDWYYLQSNVQANEGDPKLERIFKDFSQNSFPIDFLQTQEKPEEAVERKIKQKYYSNPVYKNLLALDIDLFINRQPKKFKLTNSQEMDLYTKRCILTSYYDSLRTYSKLPYTEEFETFFDGSKSFSNKVYNQQFKGTLRSVRRLFALTTDPNSQELTKNQAQVLKFDQPLYELSPNDKFSPYHEELPNVQISEDGSLLKQSPFIRDTLTRPLYAGWDENLRKFVITNKLLARNVAGYEMTLNSELSKNFYSDTKNSFFSKDSKKFNTIGSQKINFTTWPLSMNQLEKSETDSKIPYVTLFVSNLLHIKNPIKSLRIIMI
jgi:hypothetical protein